MCNEPDAPDNVEITKGGDKKMALGKSSMMTQMAFFGDDKPVPPPNTDTTRDGKGLRSVSPANIFATKG